MVLKIKSGNLGEILTAWTLFSSTMTFEVLLIKSIHAIL